jgi:hypothetical protein
VLFKFRIDIILLTLCAHTHLFILEVNLIFQFSQGIEGNNSVKWIEAMNDELKSMDQNKVWDIIELPEGYKTVGCKWVFKTKCDSKGNIEQYKARLVAKGFTQK